MITQQKLDGPVRAQLVTINITLWGSSRKLMSITPFWRPETANQGGYLSKWLKFAGTYFFTIKLRLVKKKWAHSLQSFEF